MRDPNLMFLQSDIDEFTQNMAIILPIISNAGDLKAGFEIYQRKSAQKRISSFADSF